MNEKGYFLVYDALVGIIILAMLVGLGYYIFDNEHTVYETENNYVKTSDILIELKNTQYEDEDLLSILAYKIDLNENKSGVLSEINKIIRSSIDYYTLSDMTTNITYLNYPKIDYKNVYSSHYIIDNHTFELKYYT